MRPLVQRDEEDRGIVVESIMGAVSVVHVPVQNQHALGVAVCLKPSCGDRDVVEEAEAHRLIGRGMVARGPGRDEGVLDGALNDGPRRGDRRARAANRGIPRRRGHLRIRVDRYDPLGLFGHRAGLTHPLHLLLRVHAQQVL